MQRATLNLIVDLATAAAGLLMAVTGLVMRLVLPPGSRGGHGLQLWGATRHDWGDLHWYSAIALAALVLVHLALHWNWVCTVVTRWVRPASAPSELRSRNPHVVLGSALLVTVLAALAGFVWWARAEARREGAHGEGRTEASHVYDARNGPVDRTPIAQLGAVTGAVADGARTGRPGPRGDVPDDLARGGMQRRARRSTASQSTEVAGVRPRDSGGNGGQ